MNIKNKLINSNLNTFNEIKKMSIHLFAKTLNLVSKNKYKTNTLSSDKITSLCEWIFDNEDGEFTYNNIDNKQTKTYKKNDEIIMTLEKSDEVIFTKFKLLDFKNNIASEATSFDDENFYCTKKSIDPNVPSMLDETTNAKLFGRYAINNFCNNIMTLMPEENKTMLACENYHLYYSSHNTSGYIRPIDTVSKINISDEKLKLLIEKTKFNEMQQADKENLTEYYTNHLPSEFSGESYLKTFPAEEDSNTYFYYDSEKDNDFEL